MYNINFDKLISDLLPPLFRLSPRMQAWLSTLLTPLQTFYNTFLSFVTAQKYSTGFTGQVLSLKYLLNDTYFGNGTYNLMRIEDSDREQPLYLYNIPENEPAYIYNKSEAVVGNYILNSSEPTGYDFTVLVPFAYNFPPDKDIEYLKALVNKHKVAGFQFNIDTY
jgi:hypothetical protein